jgi:hypothetical protein
MTGPVSYASERRAVALACRMLAMEGLAAIDVHAQAERVPL